MTITAPAAGVAFAGGDVIDLRATAVDARGSLLANAQLEWWVVLHHATHTHPFLPASSGGMANFQVPRTGELASDVFYRIHVRAVNDRGLADTAVVDIPPRLMQFTVQSDPAGLSVLLDHQPRATPTTITSVVGMEWPIGIASGQILGGVEYEFAAWSHGGTASQSFVMPDTNVTLTARLRDVGIANSPPTVAITTPVTGAIVTAGSPSTLAATAADANGTVSLVEFFSGSTKIGSDAAAPYAVEWVPTGTGQRQLAARATDNRGAYTMSSAVSVTVQTATGDDRLAPTVALTSPAHGTRELSGSITITATAGDNIGVAAVDFFVDGFALSSDDTPPFEAVIPSTAQFASGAHTVGAKARDAAGNVSDWSMHTVTFAGAVAVPAGFTLAPYVSGFSDILTASVMAADGRIFVCEQSGRLRVVKNGVLLPEPAISVAALHDGEQGLIGIALHPGFATNHYVYLYYTTAAGGPHNRIVRYTLAGDVAIAGSETVLVDFPPLGAPKHNGGMMVFGGDGKLYVAVGDNTDGPNSQSLETTFGKMLRFNSDGSIPSDNPFYAQTTGLNRAIWARGLRNPFSFAIEAGTGKMLINDVGAATWEEINLGRAGANYGWPASEGPTANPTFDTPLLPVRHDDSPTLFEASAIVGAAFYQPTAASFGAVYLGSYFFADYVYKWIYRLDPTTGKANAFARVSAFPTGLLVGHDGALYILNGTSIDRVTR